MAASAAECLSLLECFQRFPDPRDPRGVGNIAQAIRHISRDATRTLTVLDLT
ncbi:hypothetical protein [Nonomuraea diastatica]|uniref:hypothetical protein n=1 Tax=Nonomuraea diastatica TaxID=1848329 RepID=UPI00140A8879|nr:hypothetical protein [Nonomuraea diastatica]